MADTDIGWAHAQGAADLLEPLAYPLHIGKVSGDPIVYPYLALWPPPASRQSPTMNGTGGASATTTFRLTAAALDVREVITAMDRASDALHMHRPTVPGRRCGVFRQTGGAGSDLPQVDQQLSTPERPVYFTVAVFTLHSTASPEEP